MVVVISLTITTLEKVSILRASFPAPIKVTALVQALPPKEQ
jgi:hypothetical protein